jgi:hypothetical protein
VLIQSALGDQNTPCVTAGRERRKAGLTVNGNRVRGHAQYAQHRQPGDFCHVSASFCDTSFLLSSGLAANIVHWCVGSLCLAESFGTDSGAPRLKAGEVVTLCSSGAICSLQETRKKRGNVRFDSRLEPLTCGAAGFQKITNLPQCITNWRPAG